VERLEQAGIAAMVYTSPSHTEDAPHWRVLCPTFVALPPTERARLLSRLNGVVGGGLSPESWTLSQSYYFGSVNRNPAHQVQLIDGTPIDQRPDLDAGAISRPCEPAKAAKPNTRPVSSGTPTAVSGKRLEGYRVKVLSTLANQAVEGQKHYALLRAAKALGGIQAEAKFTDETAIQWMMDEMPDSVADWDLAERTAADGLARGRAAPLVLEDRPARSVGGVSDAGASARRAVAAVIFRQVRARSSQADIEAAAYAAGDVHGLTRPEVEAVSRWVASKLEIA
jgi:hypothetical protein